MVWAFFQIMFYILLKQMPEKEQITGGVVGSVFPMEDLKKSDKFLEIFW
jgi:hypothetical protein